MDAIARRRVQDGGERGAGQDGEWGGWACLVARCVNVNAPTDELQAYRL